jgi:hypothetical protein
MGKRCDERLKLVADLSKIKYELELVTCEVDTGIRLPSVET